MVQIEGLGKPIAIAQGDLVIITKGAEHVLFSDKKSASEVNNLETVIEESGYTGEGTLVYGDSSNDHETQLICGHFSFDDQIKHPLIDQLPDHILIKNYGENSGSWMEQTLKIVGNEAATDTIGSNLISHKLSEVIFVQALRVYLSSTDNINPGLAGFTDTRIAKSLRAIHESPGGALES